MRALVLLFALFSVSCERATEPALSLGPCHVEGLAEEIRCGTLEVAENRDDESSRRLQIQIAVLPPLRRGAAPDPLFLLAGGPGQGARSLAGAAARFFKDIRRRREIVLVDLRGTGASHPLGCDQSGDELLVLAGDLSQVARDCLSAVGVDPRDFTHHESLADLEDVRRALGYERINLWGGSWGTRAALLYALRFPAATRAVVLDGAVALTLKFPTTTSADAQRALDLLIDDCRQDVSCHEAFPDPAVDIVRLQARLAADLPPVTFRHPRTNHPTTLRLSPGLATDIIRGALYLPRDAVAALQLARSAADGDFGPLVAQHVRTASVTTDDVQLGATMSVLCSEDMPFTDREAIARAAQGSAFGTAYADAWQVRCDHWVRGHPIDEVPTTTSPVPALILSGGRDPVTPPSRGEQMARHFPHHRHVVVPAAAHNTSFTGCVPDLIATFLDLGSAEPLDAACVERVAWPRLVVSPTGSRP